jgi:tRNA (guanosine-2'-O-)-methyltransferase
LSRRRKYKRDGTPVPKSAREPLPEPSAEEAAALDAFTDTLPAELRAFRDFRLLGTARRHRIESAVRQRTRSLCLVLHGVHDPHNQAAVVRTSEALGLQEMHVVERPGARWNPSERITQAAHKWVDVFHHPSFEAAAAALRDRGLRILAAALTDTAVPLHAIEPLRPTALVLGAEAKGLPQEVIAACDGTFQIPMYGLTQSFNVSVAAAIVASFAVEARRVAWGSPGDLPEVEQMALRRRFYARAAGRIPDSLAARLAEADAAAKSAEAAEAAGHVTSDTPEMEAE